MSEVSTEKVKPVVSKQTGEKRKSTDTAEDSSLNKMQKVKPVQMKIVNLSTKGKMNSVFEGTKKPGLSGISLKVSSAKSNQVTSSLPKKASVFGDEESDEEEEMPPEAKMRMKNIGRDTPTSAGPNSFGKTKIGFCDTKKINERLLSESK